MDVPLADEVQAQLAVFEEVLGSLESRLQPFLGQAGSTAVSQNLQLPPLERAQAQLALGQATAALFQLYLRAAGVDPADHESRTEQERLAQYSKKVRKAAAAEELRQSRRSLEVDVAAVNRFISAAVPDLTREQKAALKEAGQQDGGHKRGEPASGGGEAGGHGDAELAAAAFLEEAMVELGGGGAAGGEAVAAGGKKQKKKQAKRSRK